MVATSRSPHVAIKADTAALSRLNRALDRTNDSATKSPLFSPSLQLTIKPGTASTAEMDLQDRKKLGDESAPGNAASDLLYASTSSVSALVPAAFQHRYRQHFSTGTGSILAPDLV